MLNDCSKVVRMCSIILSRSKRLQKQNASLLLPREVKQGQLIAGALLVV